MALPVLPIFNIPPNWSAGVTENMTWQTRVLVSDVGAEQRSSLRLFPRRTFEYSVDEWRGLSARMETIVIENGGLDMWLPLWPQQMMLTQGVAPGDTWLTVDSHYGIDIGATAAMVLSDGPENFEIVQLNFISGQQLVLTTPLTKLWREGTKVYPAKIARFDEQATLRWRTGSYSSGRVRLSLREPNYPAAADFSGPFYEGYWVFGLEPDFRSPIERKAERKFSELNSPYALPFRMDVANFSFRTQQQLFTMFGQQEQYRLRQALTAFHGRRVPAWIPSFTDDFILSGDSLAGASNLIVERNGHAEFIQGVGVERKHIQIIDNNGTTTYHRIVDAIYSGGDNEILDIWPPLPFAVGPSRTRRVCTMMLARMNSDSIDIEHDTDSQGVAQCNLSFRSFPDIRSW